MSLDAAPHRPGLDPDAGARRGGARVTRPLPDRAWRRLRGLLLAATLATGAAGCATTTSPPLGHTERLPEGTLPPAKEVGPPVNIQPAPLARDEYRAVPRAWGPVYGPFHGRGWYGPRCLDPYWCNRWRPGFGLHYRVF